jgi:3-hydroxyisobutyrate dehydrogenase
MRIGFLGLGSMGAPMARNLCSAKFDVVVFDIDPARQQAFLELGANVAESADQLAGQVDVLMTSLPGPRQFPAVAPAILAALRPDSLWIDLTTNDRLLLCELATDAAARRIDFLESPVTGAVDGARKGKLTLFLGGDSAVVARAQPFLAPLGRTIHCGGVGT